MLRALDDLAGFHTSLDVFIWALDVLSFLLYNSECAGVRVISQGLHGQSACLVVEPLTVLVFLQERKRSAPVLQAVLQQLPGSQAHQPLWHETVS